MPVTEDEATAIFAHHGDKLLYRVPEAARLLALGPSKMWELIARGEIESVEDRRCPADQPRRDRGLRGAAVGWRRCPSRLTDDDGGPSPGPPPEAEMRHQPARRGRA